MSHPFSAIQSVMFSEGYGTKRVEEIVANSTAYTDQAGKLLVSPLLTYLQTPVLMPLQMLSTARYDPHFWRVATRN